MVEAELKMAEQKAAKAKAEEKLAAREEAKELAEKLRRHKVTAEPILIVDDDTVQSLAKVLASQGGRLLQAGAEGTPIENAKGRYSKAANFEVYLKGHAGDTLRTGRISRTRETADRPALSVALALQPSVLQGMAEEATMAARGYLARWAYSIPKSRVGYRKIAGEPIAPTTAANYKANLREVWSLRAPGNEFVVRFSVEADLAMREFESWLEPQMAAGEPLAYLAGWAQKLAGLIARIALSLHFADYIDPALALDNEIAESVVRRAIVLGRDYFLPHAKAAFGLMGADPAVADAKRILDCLSRHPEMVEPTRVELWRPLRGSFRKANDMTPGLGVLISLNYMREYT
ncbi:MAG: DUF3987 domain-containing protein, partial [Candidatus Acidiferrum sp.]